MRRGLLVVGCGAVLASACGGGSEAVAPPTVPATPTERVELLGTDDLRYAPAAPVALEGTVTVELTSAPAVRHTLVLDDGTSVVEADAGTTASATVELAAGTYRFHCDVPGHEAAGMVGELTVVAGG